MLRLVVQSQMIRSVGYDAASSLLEVEFQNGSVYEYGDVPEQVVLSLKSAESHGKYLRAHIVGSFVARRTT